MLYYFPCDKIILTNVRKEERAVYLQGREEAVMKKIWMGAAGLIAAIVIAGAVKEYIWHAFEQPLSLIHISGVRSAGGITPDERIL